MRAERFEGVKFRRQKVVGRYIADFAANDPKLVIEVDGHTHDADDGPDASRTIYLERQGYHVLRFTNLEMMLNMEGVLARLAEVIGIARGGLVDSPLPTLSPEGERVL